MFLLENQKGEELKKQRIVIYALAGGFLVLLLAALLTIRSNRAKRKANAMLELKSLRAQMNPHFIFNSLNSVNSFISKNDDRSANKYLAQFSRLMRMVLENSKHDFVSLDSEIEMVEIEKLVSIKSCKILTIRCICSRQMSLWIICHLLLSKTMQLGMYI